MMVRIHVAQQHGRAVDGVDDHVDLAVVEQVAKGRAARRDDVGQAGALDRRNVLEFPLLSACVRHVVKQQRPLGKGGAPVVLVHLRVDVAVDHEQVEPAVVVVVEEAVAPADKGDGGLRDAGLVADVGETVVAVVVVEHLVVVAEVGDEKADLAVVLIVAGSDAHGGDLAAVFIQREAGDVALVVEGAVALVDVEEVGLGVVADQQVGFAVAVRGR